ncbi:MAG: hypothetical protein HW390_2735 [Candidatus Brocadiaceae bacterium]|nr:hypothetical protein [Candidatus Brocadiaceae bacterium]
MYNRSVGIQAMPEMQRDVPGCFAQGMKDALMSRLAGTF